MSKYLGDVSAYAYAVSKGYTGTEEEFAELMASYATVGQTAVTAAQTATTKASEAATSATTASTKASEATTAATTATTKASEASTSAQTASTKASEASQSASTASTKASQASQSASQALTYKTAAESAKTASQTAQELAETAQTAAETAQGLAEDARDLAQQYAESIDPEHIFSAYPTDTASGAIVSFTDGANDIPLKSLVVDINPIQSGSGDPSPDNVRPISGWTGAKVVRCGKNLLDPSLLKDQTAWNIIPIYAPVGTVLTMSTNQPEQDTSGLLTHFRIPGGTQSNTTTVYAGHPITKTVGEEGYLEVVQRNRDSITSYADYEYQIELGSTATEYEPYAGQTIPISWQTEAGTVYGGKLDVLSGVLTVDRYFIDPSQWTQYGASNGYIAYQIRNLPAGRYGVGNDAKNKPLSNIIAEFGSFSSSTMNKNIIQPPRTNSNAAYMALQDGIDPTTVELSYLMIAPRTIQLTPHEVKSLLGQNNIFADTGDTSVEYRADTKLYISRLTEPDADMIADANIVSGQYFMVGNNLYKATANIASGASVIVGTNAVKVSLAQALNEINA